MPSIILPSSGIQVELKDHGRISADDMIEWTEQNAALAQGSISLAPLKRSYPFIAQMIDSWGFPDLSPSDPASIGRLDFADMIELNEKTLEIALRAATDRKNSKRPST